MTNGHEPRLCTYTMIHDSGFAPNPFWGYCTLALCTPNHVGAQLVPGDWIMGHTTVEDGSRLIYAMKVTEVLTFNEYFDNSRFARKKPRFDRTWKEKCGDNIYHRVRNRWSQLQPAFHGSDFLAKDTKYPRVFVSNHFYYFGANSVQIPRRFAILLWNRHGCKYRHPPGKVREFLKWLEEKFAPGIHGDPLDRKLNQQFLDQQPEKCSKSRKSKICT